MLFDQQSEIILLPVISLISNEAIFTDIPTILSVNNLLNPGYYAGNNLMHCIG
jgi:hypothetical protein